MRIKIVSFIKKQDAGLREVEGEYLKRIRRWVPCDLIEIDREKIERSANKGKLLEAEMKRLGAVLKGNAALVVLDRKGSEWDSEGLSHWFGKRMEGAEKELVFLVGGPLGLSDELVNQARWKLSLSKLTFPHKIVRVLILEMLYRSLAILNRIPYHK